MLPGDIKVTQKMTDLLKSKKKIIHCEGVTGSSKSFTLGLKFFFNIFDSPKNETQYVIAASDATVVERMFIENPASFYNIFKSLCTHMQKGVGGNKIVVEGRYGKKNIYLIGYDDKSRWKKILGLGIHGFLVEEIHTASEEFIREMFTRVYRDDGFLYTSSNGGIPTLTVYIDYLNKSRPHPKYVDDVPKSTMSYLLECEPDNDYEFWFYKFEDNPVLSPEQIDKMYSAHPKGSFEYMSKILGIRGFTDGVLYGHLIKPEHTVEEDKINYGAIIDVIYGIDVGSGDSNNQSNAKNIIVAVAYSMGHQRAVVLDGIECNDAEHMAVIRESEVSIRKMLSRFGYKVRGVYIDSAEATLISTFRKNKTVNIPIEKSIKLTKDITAKTRVSLKEQLLLADRLLFANNEGAQKVKSQLMLVKGKNGEVVDENMMHNDYNDALDYALTPRFHQLLNAKRLH